MDRSDSLELRKRILSLSQSEARELGIAKSILHYLRKKAEGHHSFKVYSKIHGKLDESQ